LPIDSSTVDFHGPTVLPDGRTLMLYVHDKGERSGVAIVEGSPPHLKRVYDAPRWASVSYSRTGHLLGTAGDTRLEIWAVPFSASSRKVTGPAFRVVSGAAFASTSSDGLLAAFVDSPLPMGQLVWHRRYGGEEIIGEPRQGLSGPSLSPDGERVAYAAEQDDNSDIWVQDLARGTRTRLTSSPAREEQPSWSPDGTRLFYASDEGVAHAHIVVTASDGSGSPDTLAQGRQPVVSPDGRNLVYTVDHKGSGDLWMLALDGKSAAKPFLATPADEQAASFSPDGRWLAYVSNESGSREIYIRRFPEGDARAQVSVNGGTWPRWTRRGDGIYYVMHDSLLLVPVGTGPRPTLGLPRPLFTTSDSELELSASVMGGAPADAHPDGVRFIAVRQVGPPAPPSLLFVENWFEEFRKR
jgi:WD40 repeat protein